MCFFQAPYFAVKELEETVRHPAYPEEESVSTGPGPPSNSQREASGARGGETVLRHLLLCQAASVEATQGGLEHTTGAAS